MSLADRLEFELCSVRETIANLENKLKLSDLNTKNLEHELAHTRLLYRKSKITIKRLQHHISMLKLQHSRNLAEAQKEML